MQIGLHPRDVDRLTVDEFDTFRQYIDQQNEQEAS